MLALAASLLVWFLPARWVLPQIEPKLHGLRLQQVQGSLWDGRAGQVLGPDGRLLGQLQWQLSRSALLGKVRVQLNFDGPEFGLSGTVRRLSSDQIELDATHVHVAMTLLGQHAASPLGQPRGELQVAIDHALLQGGWPLQLQAQAQWHDAGMPTATGVVALGELNGQAQAQGGVIQAQLHDDGHGPLQVDGRLQVIPLGWRLDATLAARHADPGLRRWLDQFGPVDQQGRVHVQRSGGMADSAAVNSSTRTPMEKP